MKKATNPATRVREVSVKVVYHCRGSRDGQFVALAGRSHGHLISVSPGSAVQRASDPSDKGHGMDEDPRLADMLDRWEEAQERGEHLSAEELCADCPELLDELTATKVVHLGPPQLRPT